jgi:hypothetical protein
LATRSQGCRTALDWLQIVAYAMMRIWWLDAPATAEGLLDDDNLREDDVTR